MPVRKSMRTSGRRPLTIALRRGFALRLYQCIEKCGSPGKRAAGNAPFEAFKKRLAASGVKLSEATVRGWLPPLELLKLDPKRGSQVREVDWKSLRMPDLPSLLDLSNVLDVSVDYLLGFSVPMRRSDREPVGELARALLAHVIQDYRGRVSHHRREGLGEILGGTVRRRKYAGFAEFIAHEKSDHFAAFKSLDELRDYESFDELIARTRIEGELVVDASGLSIQVLDVQDRQRFLQLVCDCALHMAETVEELSTEPKREAVRAKVSVMSEHAPALASSMQQTEDDVLRNLLNAALDPLNPPYGVWVKQYERAAKKAGLSINWKPLASP